VPSPWAWSPQHRGYQGESGCACRYSTIAAWSYASRHPTSLCRRQRRCRAGSALGSATAPAALPLGGPRLRVDDGSEILGSRLAIPCPMQTNHQCWSEQEMIQFPDWSRLQGRVVAWDGSRTPENAQRRQCNKPDGGALKGGRREYGEQISCHPIASAHAATVLPMFGKYLSVSIGGGESYETKASAVTPRHCLSSKASVSVSTRPSSPGSGKLGVAGIGMGCLRGTWKQTSVFDAF
jgi:hypothetical protein